MSNEPERWPCVCVRRDAKGNLTHVRLHTVTVKSCRECGATRPELTGSIAMQETGRGYD